MAFQFPHFAPRRHALTALAALAFSLVFTACPRRHEATQKPQGLLIQNPYAEVNWANDGRFKANFHAHTTSSDGKLTPHDVIDRYHSLGYSILAITDHDKVTYPWDQLSTQQPDPGAMKRFAEGKLESSQPEYEDRDPQELKMISIQACEFSSHHHACSFFNDHNGSETEEESFDIVTAKNGLAILNHPGRYHKTADWYVSLYRAFPALIGLEVFNQGDRFPNDRATWDAILTKLMPARPVWGYSNDDMHSGAKHLGHNWNMMLLPELSIEWVRRAMVEGRSYFVYAPGGHTGPPPPVIEAINLNNRAGIIQIRATACTNIIWISEGRLVHQGDTIRLAATKISGTYVRAEIQGISNTVAATQPFGLLRPVRTHLELDARPGQVKYLDSSRLQARLEARNLSSFSIAAELTLRLGESILGRHTLNLTPGEEKILPLAIPIEALNQGKTLDVDTELSPEYGEFRTIREHHDLATPLPLSISSILPSTGFTRIFLRNTLVNSAITAYLSVAIDSKTVLRETLVIPKNETTARNIRLANSTSTTQVLLRAVAEFDPEISATAVRHEAILDSRTDKPVPRLQKAITPDAILSDWGIPPFYVLAEQEDVFPLTSRERWNGIDDLGSAIFLGWDGDALCIAAKIRDNAHHNAGAGDQLWNGDCIQFAIAPEGGEPCNAAMALTPDGVRIHQWYGHPLEIKPGSHGSVIRRESDHATYYELRIPLVQLGIPPIPGMRLGFAAVIFDDDTGQGHKYWMQTSPGLAGGWAPETLPRFYLAL